jgi:hypothetical protein
LEESKSRYFNVRWTSLTMAWQDLRDTEYIVIHHSAQVFPMAKDWLSIRALHRLRFQNGIGYARIIERDGTMVDGRKAQMVGAHAPPNRNRFGICLIGWNEALVPALSRDAVKAGWQPEWAWTEKQWDALIQVHLPYLIEVYPKALICGHNQTKATLCPGVDLPRELMIRGWPYPERLLHSRLF